jgi:hypothetical protein
MCEHQQEQNETRQTVEEYVNENVTDKHVVTVTIDGGMVSWVDVPQGSDICVVVKDYDTDGSDEEDLCVDDQGDECAVQLWTDEPLHHAGRPPKCAACGDRGWILAFNTDRRVTEIQRCDTCQVYDSDEEAAKAAVPLLESGLKRVEQSAEEPHGNTDSE